MEDILRLIEIQKKRGHRSIQLLNQNFRKSEISKDNLLYEKIVEKELGTDEEAAMEVFKAAPNNRNYRNAKSKLRQKLLNHLYFLDYDKQVYSDYERYEYESYHTLHQAKILIVEGEVDIATKKLLQLLKFAKICEFIDVIVLSLVWLKRIYAEEGKLGFFSEVELALRYYRSFQSAVRDSEDLYYKELVQINKSYSAQTRALQEVPQSIELIQKHANEFNSVRMDVLAQKLELLYSEITNELPKVISICDEIEDIYFTRKDGEVRVDFDEQNIYLIKLKALYNNNELRRGLDFAVEKESKFKSSTDRWYDFVELRFLLAFNAKDFELAAEYFREVKSDKQFNIKDDMLIERWQIYRAFLIYFNDQKLVKWGFNHAKFLTSKLEYTKEYSGYSIATLCARFMYFLRENDLKGISACLAELDQYNSSHLDKRSNYRNSIFIRLLNLIPENDFNYELVKEKGQTYFQKLIKTQIPPEEYTDLEVMRYDLVWEEILNVLQTNKEYVHFKFYHFASS